jgi:hypothetical protein
MKEAKVSQTLESEEYTCFNRLYDDAKRRQEKQRKLAEERFGITDPVLDQRRGSSVGMPPRRPSTLPAPTFMQNDTVSAGEAYAYTYPGGGYGSNFQSRSRSNSPDAYGGGNSPLGGSLPAYPGHVYGQMHGQLPQMHGQLPPNMSGAPSLGYNGRGPGQYAQPGHGQHNGYMSNTWPPQPSGPQTVGGTGMNFVVGYGMLPQSGDGHRFLMRTAPAGEELNPRNKRSPRDGMRFAMEGFNPVLGPVQASMPLPKELAHGFANDMTKTIRLGASASAPQLPGTLNAPPGGVSAMAIDTRANSPTPSSAGSKRRLIGSRSAPKLATEELPPLAHERYEELIRTSTNPSGFASPLGITSWNSGNSRAKALGKLHRGRLQKTGTDGQGESSGGIEGWSISGQPPPLSE